ncbi:Phosphatidate cytidylyltransferase/Mmp37 [Carpediemonas membranifera]|uniref:Phosphatidate cytidylyltransferase/Mmp37 n=1 Tax=Carpediemonas membranifera TaxID=201153 RepID=A0A8J6E5U9_9EUKA|nr:Phosphatidate cytidylyltransferase/Mmp37 [Carpediemonas membranifera]|eukprot:KAG9396337.1 Phosphatidate cytidylyltransferase/Mmp37 [Carpediemonas membranifera]
MDPTNDNGIELDDTLINTISDRFHGPGLRLVLAYGDLHQPVNVVTGDRTINLFVVVDDEKITEWHSNNLRRNPTDYGFICRVLPEEYLKAFQRSATGLVTMPPTPLDPEDEAGIYLSYSIISFTALLDDLAHWTHSMAAAGPLLGAVHVIDGNEQTVAILNEGLEKNRTAALCAAMLTTTLPAALSVVLAKITTLVVSEGMQADSAFMLISDMIPHFKPIAQKLGMDPDLPMELPVGDLLKHVPDIGLDITMIEGLETGMRQALVAEAMRDLVNKNVFVQFMKDVATGPFKRVVPFIGASINRVLERLNFD